MDKDIADDSLEVVRDVTGVILAGGRSSRFGSDKASAFLLGRPLLQWVSDALQPVCTNLVVVSARGQSLPSVTSSLPLTVVTDEVDHEGPFAGLLAGLAAVSTEWAFVTSCDAPLLQPQLVQLLHRSVRARCVAVFPRVGGRIQPLSALYGTSALPEFRALFDDGERRPSSIAERLATVIVEEADLRTADPHLRTFHNANTRSELDQLAELAQL